jgi:cyclic lactone autoinducer peptide
MKKIALKLLKNMSTLSLGIAGLSVNCASSWFVYQAKEPKELDRLKKIR